METHTGNGSGEDEPKHPELEVIKRLDRDIAKAADSLTEREARYLVDAYYLVQKYRVSIDNQIRSMESDEEPVLLLHYMSDQSKLLESQAKLALKRYSKGNPTGKWMMSILGIGPVISAGLLAHIDIHKAPTAGHIWNFAGLNPGIEWGKGQKRPWNATLKTLCWKLGESFVKVSNNENSFYGPLYKERKALEEAHNIAGDYADQAAEVLKQRKIGKDKAAYLFYAACLPAKVYKNWANLTTIQRTDQIKKLKGEPGTGLAMLPPAHIHARAKRWVVKLFLSHLHHVWFVNAFDSEPPVPYAIAHLGHAHLIKPPMEGEG